MLHNIVVHIQRSPQRLAAFREFSKGWNISRDNSTRWNSWCKMISSALALRKAINLYCLEYNDNTLDQLLPDHWEGLQKLHDF